MRRLLAALLAAATFAACVRPLSDEELSDPALKARISAALSGRSDLDLRYVSFDVDAGVVTLSGIVADHAQRRDIQHIAARVRGVEHVLNNLVVQE